MNVKFPCPTCHTELDAEAAGDLVKCPKCGSQLTVPMQTPRKAVVVKHGEVHVSTAAQTAAVTAQPEKIEIVGIRMRFQDVFVLVSKIFVATILLSLALGAVVYGIWFLSQMG